MNIYLARPISGCTPLEVAFYYKDLAAQLGEVGYTVLCPMKGKGTLRTELIYRSADYRAPVATNNSIVNRDRWMVKHACDIVYMNLIGAKQASIGCMFELAWANESGKYVVLAMDEKNIHNHAFVKIAAHTIFPTHEEAVKYLIDFVREGVL
jgi:hypothetical protein